VRETPVHLGLVVVVGLTLPGARRVVPEFDPQQYGRENVALEFGATSRLE
jgi:hypothetical protein